MANYSFIFNEDEVEDLLHSVIQAIELCRSEVMKGRLIALRNRLLVGN